MPKKILLITLSVLLALGFALIVTGCTDNDDTDSNPVQVFIDENRAMLTEVSESHLEDLGPGATVDFLADDNEFIYVYTFGQGPTAEELSEYVTGLLDYPSNTIMYQELAGELAALMELDALTVTVRYYDGQGNYVGSESYDSQ
ncbi:MAG: DUF4854 domain-containing protein [Coriobacteriia bacterium]|nr:DUF4854 domain-containing protein [Coriobacteriia bacterium]